MPAPLGAPGAEETVQPEGGGEGQPVSSHVLWKRALDPPGQSRPVLSCPATRGPASDTTGTGAEGREAETGPAGLRAPVRRPPSGPSQPRGDRKRRPLRAVAHALSTLPGQSPGCTAARRAAACRQGGF